MRLVLTLAAFCLPLAATAEPDFEALQQTFPQIRVAAAQPSAVAGVWELLDNRGQVFYLTEDGQHLFAGELVQVEGKRSLTEQRRKQVRTQLLTAAPDDLLRFPAADPQHQITVVTDIDCTYCRRLHQQIADFNQAKISVDYLIMPRSGLAGASYQKAVNAVCANRPNRAFTAAMSGQANAPADCDHSVAEQFNVARQLGVTGTPAIVLDDGSMVHGYLPPEKLLARLQRPN